MRALLAATLFALAVPSACAQDTAAFADATDAFVAETLDRFGTVPGLAVAVVRDGETVYARGFGHADREAQLEATPDTPFYIASATKPFTALLAALLDHEGTLALDATLADLFPDVAFDSAIEADAVTVRHLLSHTAGIDNGPLAFRAAFTGQHTPTEMRRLLAGTAVEEGSPRGTFDYTNVGYNVLSLRLDEIAPWQEQLAARVFEPLGMSRTTAVASEAEGGAVPYAVHPTRGAERIALVKHDDTMQAAGGMMASANDLARWLAVHLDGGRLDGRQIVPADVIAEVHRPVAVGRGESYGALDRDGYALGWHTGTYDGDRLLHHLGGFAGFHAHTSFMPERGVGVVVLANEAGTGGRLATLFATTIYDWWAAAPDARDTVMADARDAADALYDGFQGAMARARADLDQRAARTWQLSLPAEAYAGTFAHPDYGTMVVEAPLADAARLAVQFGRLHAVATPFTQPETIRVELIPESGQTIQFVLDGDRVRSLVWNGLPFERSRDS
ncbi:serine hydrolase [Rubrivirga sp. IMCC43871]|uniref:serine hydrolase n=1 Tax=Rubrivirga sp. IMCC43871 TaxID=3391575 RepID=UPI0039900892